MDGKPHSETLVELILCVGQSNQFTATINPPSAPVTFSISDPSIASLTQNGSSLTVTSLVAGTAFVVSWLNGAFVSVAPVYGVEVKFATNEFYVPEGGTNYTSVESDPAFKNADVQFFTMDPSIADVVPGSSAQRVGVWGVTNGTTTLVALVDTNLYCVFKDVTVLPFEKLPLGQSLTRNRPGYFKVYVPTRWGGALTIGTTAGTITDLKYPDGLIPYPQGRDTGTNYGWYTFSIPDSSSYTVSNTFEQIGEAAKRPWNFFYWPSKADYIYERGTNNGGNGRADSTALAGSDDLQIVPTGSTVPAGGDGDVIRAGPDGVLQSTASPDDQMATMLNLYDVPGPLSKYDAFFTNTTTARSLELSQHQGIASWEGHCWGATVASLVLNQPSPTAASGLGEDELEGLWAMLGEDGPTEVRGIALMTNCPAGPPVSGMDPTDGSVGSFHAGLEQYLRGDGVALHADLRSDGGTNTEVWNHAIWRYASTLVESTNGLETVVSIANTVTASADIRPSTNGPVRTIVYHYDLEYGPSGDVLKTSAKNDWRSVSGEASWAPKALNRITGVSWASIRGVTESHLRELDESN